jgi:hypothetical protein
MATRKSEKAKAKFSASPRPRVSASPLVAVLMGSKSDWDTMRAASETLANFGVAHESHVMSAHRTPGLASDFRGNADARGIEVIIAAAGGAAHLAGHRSAYDVAGPGRADDERLERTRFLTLNCADAGWDSGGNVSHRQGGRNERGAIGDCHLANSRLN